MQDYLRQSIDADWIGWSRKRHAGFCQTEERRKEAADLIVTLNGFVFGSVRANLQERTYRNMFLEYWLSCFGYLTGHENICTKISNPIPLVLCSNCLHCVDSHDWWLFPFSFIPTQLLTSCKQSFQLRISKAMVFTHCWKTELCTKLLELREYMWVILVSITLSHLLWSCTMCPDVFPLFLLKSFRESFDMTSSFTAPHLNVNCANCKRCLQLSGEHNQ